MKLKRPSSSLFPVNQGFDGLSGAKTVMRASDMGWPVSYRAWTVMPGVNVYSNSAPWAKRDAGGMRADTANNENRKIVLRRMFM